MIELFHFREIQIKQMIFLWGIFKGESRLDTEKILEIIDGYGSNAGNIVANAQRTAREMLDYKLYTRKFIDFFFNDPDADHEPGEKRG